MNDSSCKGHRIKAITNKTKDYINEIYIYCVI